MRRFKAIALADLHCGCPRLDPVHFTETIRKFVLPKIQADVTHVFIAGDFFDLSVTMNSSASAAAMTVITELKNCCAGAGAKLRILRGTFTHDRNQSRHFLLASPEFNYCTKLYDTLAIEYDEETKLNFLYMPDNLRYSDIYEEVENLLKAHHLEKVDVVIHHGYFKHMLPPGIPVPADSLDYDVFKKYYSGCVLNGHVHTSSIYNNVVSIGSFDRFAYAEEEDKGFYIVTRSDDGLYSYEFVKNEDANPFWTINLQNFGPDTESAIKYIQENWLDKLKASTDRNITPHVRILSDDAGMIEGICTFIGIQSPMTIVNRGIATKREQIIESAKLDLETLPKITPDNLEELLIPILQKRSANVDLARVHEVLEACRKKG
jgi:hypothetical protein